MTWGEVTVGRMVLRETFGAEEVINANTGVRTLRISGQESSPPLTRTEIYQRKDALLGLIGTLVQVEFQYKPELNGYYVVFDSNANVEDYQAEVYKFDWSLSLNRKGADGETDLESRLSGIRRFNDFSLTGESWHAPSVGHYSYYTGSTSPGTMTRTTEDGTITVYRSLTAGISPRWGCSVGSYQNGRARILSDSYELTGTDVVANVSNWRLTNGIINVTMAASGSGSLAVGVWNGSAYESKNFNVTIGASGTPLRDWDSATILYNTPEYCSLRLVQPQGPNEIGRIVVDLSLRRGSRFVEGYFQVSSSATLSVHRNSLENSTPSLTGGYTVATSNDADGNKYTIGTARSFTSHTNGGITKSATTKLDFYIGSVFNGTSAVSGDAATDLRNQYIGALPEIVNAVWR